MKVRHRAMGIVAALALALRSLPVLAAVIVAGPLVQMPSENLVVVAWETSVPTVGKVLYGVDGKLDLVAKSAAVGRRHEVTLGDLAPGQQVSYRVVGGGAHSAVYTFSMPPAPGEPLRFLVLGDTRSFHHNHTAVVAQAVPRVGHLSINTGDLVNRGDSMKDWRHFFAIEKELLASTVSAQVVGNHDLAGGGIDNFLHFFVQPPSPHAPERDFYMDMGSVRFVIMDNAVTASRPVEQKKWLQEVLQAGNQKASIHHLVVVIHQGVHSNGPHGPSKSLLKQGLDDVMRHHGVAMVIAGHDHMYERGVVDGLRYMVSGGGGAPVYAKTVKRGHAEIKKAVHHLVDFTVDETGISFEVVQKDGSILESCRLDEASGGYACP